MFLKAHCYLQIQVQIQVCIHKYHFNCRINKIMLKWNEHWVWHSVRFLWWRKMKHTHVKKDQWINKYLNFIHTRNLLWLNTVKCLCLLDIGGKVLFNKLNFLLWKGHPPSWPKEVTWHYLYGLQQNCQYCFSQYSGQNVQHISRQ